MLKIIISPAKKMRILEEYPCRLTSPVFQEKAERLHAALLPSPGLSVSQGALL